MLAPVKVSSMDPVDHLQYLKPFISEQIELLVSHSNAWNHLTVWKQMIDIMLYSRDTYTTIHIYMRKQNQQ